MAAKKARIEDYEQNPPRHPHFRANPIPRACSVLIYDEKLRRDERERDERINQNAKISIKKAKMPEAMQKYAEKKKKEALSSNKLQPEQYSFKPDIGPPVTAAQLKAQQDKFQKELAKKKGQKTGTQQIPFNFSERPEKIIDRVKYDEPSKLQDHEDEVTKRMRKLAETAKSHSDLASSNMNPPSTKAVSLSQLKRRSDILDKRKRQEELAKIDEERIKKQNELKDTVQSKLKSKFGKSASQVIKEKCKEKKDAMRAEEAKSKQAIADALKRAKQRPMLLEQSQDDLKAASNLTFLKATMKMITLLKDQGEEPNKYLTDEQKEMLEEEKIKQQIRGKK